MVNRVRDLLGIEYPILAFSHCRDVVAAVTNAGGFGVLGAVAHTPDGLDQDLGWLDDQVGGRGYGVDLLVPTKHSAPESALSADLGAMLPSEHLRFVEELLVRYGVEPMPGDIAQPRGQMTVTADDNATLLDVACAHDVELLASALGPPPPWFVERAKASGAVVAALAGTVEHARRHVSAGVDIVVAQGTEAGGHTGEVATMVLVPEVVDAVGSSVPVVAAGGVATGRQMAAAFALGAEGVWCGSVWLTTDEAETHPTVKRKFLAATSSDTVRSRSLTGKPARQLRTPWTDAWADPSAPAPLPMPLQSILVGDAQRRIARQAHTDGTGAAELANYFVGQVVGQMSTVRPARQVVLDMVQEFVDTIDRLGRELS